MKILSVVGARPNFMKIAPLIRTIKKQKDIKHTLVHTGQHYDYAMSESFFKELRIPKPDINLEVGSGSHARQVSQIMARFEAIALKEKPDIVLVVGDVNSTMACSLVAVKLGIAVAHVEAGLRSFDRNMPEEINRLVTDSVADIFFTTSPDATEHLVKEGIPKERIFFVGNVMIDTLLDNLGQAKKSGILRRNKLVKKNYALVTLHRPSNVDTKKGLGTILCAINKIQKRIKVVFPIHPRTRSNLKAFFPKSALKSMENLILLDPQGYLDFLNLMMNASFVITDSGGIQEETTVLGIPCLTARENTERPITLTEGTNILVGLNEARIVKEGMKILNKQGKKRRIPKYWDGKAAQRIVKVLIALNKQKRLRRP